MSTRATKRIKRDSGELPTTFDLQALYKSDLGNRILSYASGQDLCVLDILNKQFNTLTTKQWNVVTKDRFGMNDGKEGWKVGTSFLRPAKFIHNVGGFDSADGGSAHVVANENIVAYTSDFMVGIDLRDASTLNTIDTVSSLRHWKVSICGRLGSEIIVTSNNRHVCALRKDFTQGDFIQQLEFDISSGCGIETIGCETHLIVAHDGRVQLYEVNNEQHEQVGHGGNTNNNTDLISFRKGIKVEEGAENGWAEETKLAWAPDKIHFIVGSSHKICVFKLNATNNEINLVKTIDTEWEVTNVALAEDYIVASSKNKKVHIWNRNTGDKMVYGLQGGKTRDSLCDIGHHISYEAEDFVWPLSLSCHGHILVSTSHIGCAICIWNMKTGELLKRHNEANEEGVVVMLPDDIYSDATDMAYLQRLNAFLCMGDYQNMWVFPTNQAQSEMATSICQRVETMLLESESEESNDGLYWDYP